MKWFNYSRVLAIGVAMLLLAPYSMDASGSYRYRSYHTSEYCEGPFTVERNRRTAAERAGEFGSIWIIGGIAGCEKASTVLQNMQETKDALCETGFWIGSAGAGLGFISIFAPPAAGGAVVLDAVALGIGFGCISD